MIRALKREDAAAIADLHVRALRTLLAGILGRRLLACYYRTVAGQQGACGFVYVTESGRMLGYVCGVWDRRALYKKVIATEWPWLLLWTFLYSLIRPLKTARWLRRFIPGTGRAYAGRAERELSCELRPIAVEPEARGQGVAWELTQRLLDYVRSRGFGRVYLTTEADNQRANAFYLKHGFKATAVGGCVHYQIELQGLPQPTVT